MGFKNIQSTTNYALFKMHSANRKINELNLKKLMDSMKEKNLLEYRPVLVDSRMNIIDGQHRLEAAKRLRVPVYYVESKDLDVNDIFLLNINQKNWTAGDFLNYYVSIENPEYLKFLNFMKNNSLTIAEAQMLLFGNRGGKAYHEFKNGKLKFPPIKQEQICENYKKVIAVIQFINEKSLKKMPFVANTTTRMGLMQLISNAAYDHELFMKKIEIKLRSVHRCAVIDEYYNMFKEIYNYKNQSPID